MAGNDARGLGTARRNFDAELPFERGDVVFAQPNGDVHHEFWKRGGGARGFIGRWMRWRLLVAAGLSLAALGVGGEEELPREMRESSGAR